MYYANYTWKRGKPKGIDPLSSPSSNEAFKIVTDPYHKRYTVESYVSGCFSELIYDSALLDFRKLRPVDQHAWQREILVDTPEKQKCLIRDINDRVILIEEHTFKEQRCIQCDIYSPHGLYLATQEISYKDWGEPFNGVTLKDRRATIVMKKSYASDQAGAFTQLLEQTW